MAFFKEEIFVCKNDNRGGNGNADCFDAFCRLGHRNLFLHEVYKKVKNNTCKHASVIFYINPCCYKTEGNNGNKKIEYIQNIYFAYSVMVSARNKKQREVP